MIELALRIGFAGLTLAILFGLYRLAKGPTVMDRILAFETIATCSVGMVVLLSIAWTSPFYLELILIFSLLGFVGTVAFLFHLHKTYVLESSEEAERREKRAEQPWEGK